jgi:hypothetical protein
MLAFGTKRKCDTNISFDNDIDKELHISPSENVEANSSQHHNKERETEGDNSLSSKVGDLLIGSSTLKRFGRKMYAGKVISYNKKRKVYGVRSKFSADYQSVRVSTSISHTHAHLHLVTHV